MTSAPEKVWQMSFSSSMPRHRFVAGVVLVGAAMMVGIGAWCRVDPLGFAQWANWPEHEHFLHDAGVSSRSPSG
jgi:hypothetical protein